MKRLIAGRRLFMILLLCVCLSLCLSSCSANGKAVYRLGSATVTEGMKNYALSAYKYLYLCQNKGIPDTESGWNQSVGTGDGTLATEFTEYAVSRLKSRLAAAYLYEKSGSTESPEVTRRVLGQIIETTFYYTGKTDKKGYNELLATYNTDYSAMYRCLLYEYEYEQLFTRLFGANGDGVLTDEAFAETVAGFYQQYYLHIRMTVTASTNYLAASAFREVHTSSDFEAFCTAYGEESHLFLYAYSSYDTSDQKILEAIAGLKEGEATSVTVGENTYYLCRYTTDREYKDEAYQEQFAGFAYSAARYAYQQYLQPYMEQVEILEDVTVIPWEIPTCVEENVIDIYTR